MYKVVDESPAENHPAPEPFHSAGFGVEGHSYFTLEECSGFEDLKNRVVINWGKSTLSWCQWLKAKEVIEILPEGYVSEFPGYSQVLLNFEELKKLIEKKMQTRYGTML